MFSDHKPLGFLPFNLHKTRIDWWRGIQNVAETAQTWNEMVKWNRVRDWIAIDEVSYKRSAYAEQTNLLVE